MGTNFYLKPKGVDFEKAVEDDSLVHIAKRSAGWRTCFQAHDEPGMLIRNVDHIRKYIEIGGYEVVSEYGDALTPEQFETDVVQWHGGGRSVPLSNKKNNFLVFHDTEGNELTYADFR